MQRDFERKIRQTRLLRRIREAEQYRLSAELMASQRRMNESENAGEDAGRHLDGDLQFDRLLAQQGLQAAVRSALAIAEEKRVIGKLSERNASSRNAADMLAVTERRLSGHLDAYLSNATLLEIVSTRRPSDDED